MVQSHTLNGGDPAAPAWQRPALHGAQVPRQLVSGACGGRVADSDVSLYRQSLAKQKLSPAWRPRAAQAARHRVHREAASVPGSPVVLRCAAWFGLHRPRVPLRAAAGMETGGVQAQSATQRCRRRMRSRGGCTSWRADGCTEGSLGRMPAIRSPAPSRDCQRSRRAARRRTEARHCRITLEGARS